MLTIDIMAIIFVAKEQMLALQKMQQKRDKDRKILSQKLISIVLLKDDRYC